VVACEIRVSLIEFDRFCCVDSVTLNPDRLLLEMCVLGRGKKSTCSRSLYSGQGNETTTRQTGYGGGMCVMYGHELGLEYTSADVKVKYELVLFLGVDWVVPVTVDS
jgi:hypothetical protein